MESALVSSRGVITRPDSPANALFLGQSYMDTVVFSTFTDTLWVNSEEVYVTSPHDLPTPTRISGERPSTPPSIARGAKR